MTNKFDWSTDIAWPSGELTNNYLNPLTEGTSSALLAQGEVLSMDTLERSKTAENLYKFIQKNKKGYVLNLDSAWGSGKTWFARRLYLELKSKHPVCYIDAWENDYKGEAIFLILNNIIKSLAEYQEKNSKLLDSLKNSKISVLSKKSAPEIIKAISRVDFKKIIDETNIETDKNNSNQNNPYTEILGSATKAIFEEIENQNSAVKELKQKIATLIDSSVACNSKNFTYPFVIFVDELDRCRPNFAIEILESIKHIFTIPNIFFIISTHSEQLQNSIKSIYGNNFSSDRYLEKFFDSRITLTTPMTLNFLKIHTSKHIKHLIKNSLKDIILFNDNNFYELISGISKGYEIPLRQLQKTLKEVNSIIQIKSENIQLEVLPLTILVLCRREIPELFTSIETKSKKISKQTTHKYNELFNITKEDHPPKQEVQVEIILDSHDNIDSKFNCYIANNGLSPATDMMLSVINALINPSKIEEVVPNIMYLDNLPTLYAHEIIKLNYSQIHGNTPAIQKYLDTIDFGGMFE